MHPSFHTSKTAVYLSWGKGGWRQNLPPHLKPPARAAIPQVPREHFHTGYARCALALTGGAQVIVLFFFPTSLTHVFDLPLIRKVFKLEAYCYVLESYRVMFHLPLSLQKSIFLKIMFDYTLKMSERIYFIFACNLFSANWFETSPLLLLLSASWIGGMSFLYWTWFLALVLY